MRTGFNSPTVAGLALKRIAPCEPVVSKDKKTVIGEQCKHVYKAGLCIDCKSIKNPCDWEDRWMIPKDGAPLWEKYFKKLLKRGLRYWQAFNRRFSGKGAKEYGCVPNMWFRNNYHRRKGPPKMDPVAFKGDGPNAEYSNWARHCIKAAFDSDGNLKKEFECSRERKPMRFGADGKQPKSDADIFRDLLKGF